MDTCAKGDVALGHVVADLMKRGLQVFLPVSSHACKYDLVAGYKDEDGRDVLLRIQVKYNGSWHRKYAELEDPFDLYAIYWPQYDRVSYVWFGLITEKTSFRITHQIPNAATPFYWWADFQCPKSAVGAKVKRRTATELGSTLNRDWQIGRPSQNKKIQISDIDLQRALWKKSMVILASTLGVSDRALGKHVKKRNLVSPPSGYWASNATGQKKIRKRHAVVYRESIARLEAE